MNELVSIIIPVYNVILYLFDCIETVEQQTYKNIEIILVDDGSSDGSEKLCDELSESYGNIKVIHQKNSGVSTARNNGIEASSGEYIIFVDSDDFIDPNMIEKLINARNAYPSLLPVCGIRKIYSDREKDFLIDGEKLLTIKKEDFFVIQKAQLFNAPVNKLFSRDIILKHNIRFNPQITLGEDFIFNSDYVIKTECDFVIINEPLYFYNIFVSNSLSKKYIPNILENYISMDEKYLELIDKTGTDITKYEKRLSTIRLFSIVNSIKNTMSPNNKASTVAKVKKIKKILNSFDVKQIVSTADTSAYSNIYLKMLSFGNAWIIYLFRTVKG